MKRNTDMCDCDIVHDEAVLKAKSTVLSENDIDCLSGFFKILGDPTRIKILWALDQCEMCVCDLSAAMEMTKSAISHQLNSLRQAKLVKARRDGKNVYYSLDDEHVNAIIELALTHTRHK